MNNGIRYSSRFIQAGIKRRNIAGQVENDLELPSRYRHHNRIGKLRPKKDTVLKELSNFKCQSFFKTPCVLINSKTRSI